MTRRLISLSRRIRHSVAEMDEVQRRMFEIRTGLPPARVDTTRDKAMVAELEAHFRL